MKENETNLVWQQKLQHCLVGFDYESSPRGKQTQEVIDAKYVVPLPAFVDLKARKINTAFMFAESAWLIEGSNRLSKIEPFMNRYRDFSDDGVFMSGSYGPQIVENLRYVVDTLEQDPNSRQAVFNIWRNRPGLSKDLPCTTGVQFLIRENALSCIITMRSNDVVLGIPYDVWTFSMIAHSVLLLLKTRGVNLELGNLHVNVGSLHLYQEYYEKAKSWVEAEEIDLTVRQSVDQVLGSGSTYDQLIDSLWSEAWKLKSSKELN